MENCNEAATPVETNLKLQVHEEEKQVDGTLYKQIVGSLRFLCNSRPDISFGVGLVSRFMSDPRVSHLIAANRILRYLKGTQDFGILFPKCKDQNVAKLIAYLDSDFSGDKVDRKSTCGYLFRFLDAPISWTSKKQSVVCNIRFYD